MAWRVIEKIDGLVLVSNYHDMPIAQIDMNGEFKLAFPLDEADEFDARQRLIRALAQSKLKRLEDEIRAAVRAGAIQPVTADRWAQQISQIRADLDSPRVD